MADRDVLYRNIPKVDLLQKKQEIRELTEKYGRDFVRDVIREQEERLRGRIRSCPPGEEEKLKKEIEDFTADVCRQAEELAKPRFRRVINASGTILHTNLGRAPVSRVQAEAVLDAVTGYSNLEYRLEDGSRGGRCEPLERLLCRITGAEAAFAVNNNAAAVMLILNTLAADGEVIVSRGELVEIGGNFRIPDVMKLSGARLREVGTTNKTRREDYESAVNDTTRAIMKVHTSNYRIVGFTEAAELGELVNLAAEQNIPLVEDLGSGVLVDLEKYGLPHEPAVQESVAAGADVVCFSGDKLLGGPQAGLIVGRKSYIEAMKKNPLARALRIDKITAVLLEQVLLAYLDPGLAVRNVPVLSMLTEPPEEVRGRAIRLAAALEGLPCEISVRESGVQTGGGSMPMTEIPGAAVLIRPQAMSVTELEAGLRSRPVPVIGRIREDALWLELRTVAEEDLGLIAWELAAVCGRPEEAVIGLSGEPVAGENAE